MPIDLPKYSSKDYYVLPLVVIPFSLMMNYLILGSLCCADWKIFIMTTTITGLVFSGYFMICGWWAVRLKHRFSKESEIGKKLLFMISTFLVMTGLVLLVLFRVFELIPFFNYRFDQGTFIWAYAGLGFINIFLSFLFEGISRYEDWQSNLEQTEQLKKAFQQSQLEGLKSQVNPHFLFNSLNSLSSLIEEESEEAAQFLDEMSKVYRYMLRNEEDQLVTLRSEVQFLDSYLFLLKVRFGEGLQVKIHLDPKSLDRLIPPLTLQVLVESAFNQNTLSKQDPLSIEIFSNSDEAVFIRNKVNPKLTNERTAEESGLDHLILKYKLLDQEDISIEEELNYRTVRVPFLHRSNPVLS